MTSTPSSPSAHVRTRLEEGRLSGEWVLDPARSSIALRTRHTWGLLPVNGVFRNVFGRVGVSSHGEVSGSIDVVAASIDTKNTRRDLDLRSSRFFDVDRHPNIVFTIDRITPGLDEMTVNGSLSIRDVTRPLAFPVQISVLEAGEVDVEGTAHINRAEFGMDLSFLGMASMQNTLVVHTLFTRR